MYSFGIHENMKTAYSLRLNMLLTELDIRLTGQHDIVPFLY